MTLRVFELVPFFFFGGMGIVHDALAYIYGVVIFQIQRNIFVCKNDVT